VSTYEKTDIKCPLCGTNLLRETKVEVEIMDFEGKRVLPGAVLKCGKCNTELNVPDESMDKFRGGCSVVR